LKPWKFKPNISKGSSDKAPLFLSPRPFGTKLGGSRLIKFQPRRRERFVAQPFDCGGRIVWQRICPLMLPKGPVNAKWCVERSTSWLGRGLPQVDKGKYEQKFLVVDLVGKLSNHQVEYSWVG
jgi:hypothetical protein